MELLNLKLENFCQHENTEIDLSKINTALIIGKIDDNVKKSNGSGKSNIFGGIDYVFFNECKFSSLDKIIRDGTDVCKVIVVFKADDENIYKVSRGRSLKSGSDLRLWKNNDGNWEDLTQRRVSDTEKELSKILKINYKTFLSSACFSQPRSETLAQLEFSDIATITPEKRKAILKEILQLNLYSKYEAISKLKINDLVKEFEKTSTIIETLGNPKDDLLQINNNLKHLEEELNKFNSEAKTLSNKKIEFNKELEKYKLIKNSSEKNILELKVKTINFEDEILKLKSLITSLNNRIEKIKNEGIYLSKTIEVETIKINEFKKIELPSNLDKEIQIINEELIEKKAKLQSIKLKLEELNIPFEDNEVCKYCRQTIDPKNKNNCLIQIEKDKEINVNIHNEIISNIKNLTNKKTEIEIKISNGKKILLDISNLENSINLKDNELKNKRELYSELFEQNIKLNNDLQEKINKIESLNNELKTNSNFQEIHIINEKISDLELSNSTIEKALNINLDHLKELNGKKSVLLHNQKNRLSDLEKLNDLEKSIEEIKKKQSILSKVQYAFSSSGIPSLIINNMIDNLQIDANNFLSKLRQGLQLQFILTKNKKNEEQEDTLDINYLIDGCSREYRQLSGAQKIIASLALKLSLLSTIKKQTGTNIKFLLLDEVDQALDEDGVESFYEVIKILENEYKILIITHNNELKYKFNNIIVVEQDTNMVSNGKLTKNW